MMVENIFCKYCKTELLWKMISQSGDGLVYCPKCNWHEDCTKPLEEQVEQRDE